MSRKGLLAIDVGNTNTVLGLYEDGELIEHWRVATPAKSTSDETGILFLSLFASRKLEAERVGAAIVACVVPPAVHAITRAITRYFDVNPIFVGPQTEIGMTIKYANPAEVGADRLVNAVAAYERCQCACVVVDFGTATTFDVIDGDGSYLGGVIAPGLGISLEALFERAAKLPRVKIQRPESVIGQDTVSSMQSGTIFGYVGLVDGLVERIVFELNAKGVDNVRVIATGGLAGLIAQDSTYLQAVEPMLTLDGLRIIAQRLGVTP